LDEKTILENYSKIRAEAGKKSILQTKDEAAEVSGGTPA
jgi:hypothetical protein